MYTCTFCKSQFNDVYIMKRHQHTAKYCLLLQQNDNEQYNCNHCGKNFSRRDNLLRHQKKCIVHAVPPVSEPDHQGSGLQLQLGDLMAIITKLVERPTISTATSNRNVMLNNLEPITDEEIADHIRHLTIDFIQDGAKGYANFAGSYPFKDRLLCTDKARKKLRYKDSDGELVDDANGSKLTRRFFQAIAPRNEQLINEEYKTLQQKVHQIATEGKSYTSNLTDLLTKASHLQELLIKCQQAANGEENELTREFINHLSRIV